ncbi:MAG: ABC transporter permease [Planctomycetota bacterium]|jgi:peptide/nickel transport system permease protein
MWAFLLRRTLLMIPTLFGISLLNFLLINAADAPRAGSISEDGVVDASASADAGAAERIFRSTFNLDKPVLFNTRFALEDSEIFWLVTTPMRAYSTIEEKKNARDTLEDYGRGITPHLMRIANASHEISADIRADYEERWTDARGKWLKGDPPLDEAIVWPPPEAAPDFDAKFSDDLRLKALDRLYANAPRRPRVRYGEALSEEEEQYNRDVREESRGLRTIFMRTRGDAPDPDGALNEWNEWFEANKAEWDYGFGDKVSMFFFQTRFAKFWAQLVKGDLGDSFIYRRPVSDLIWERLPISLTLSFGSLLLAYLLALPLGILSGTTHSSVSDQIITVILFALYSLPVMFLGVLLRDYFVTDLKIFAGRGFNSANYAELTVLEQLVDRLKHIALPLITLTVGSLAYYSRYMKAGLLEIIRADFIRTARAKGLSEFVVVMRHAVRNSLIPIVTLLGASLPVLIGGSVIIEYIFQIDGMGRLGWQAVTQRDYGVLLGLNFVAAILTMIGVLLTDIFYALLDPRIRQK